MKKWLLMLLLPIFLMSYNAYAVEQSVNFNHSTPISNVAVGNCSNFQTRILNPNQDTSYNIDSLCFSTVIADQVTAGQFVTISFVLGNIQDANALDVRLRNLRGDSSVFDTVDVKSYNAGNSTAIVDVTLYAKGTYTSQYFGLYRISTTGGAISLQPNEELVPLQIVVWDNGSSAASSGVAPSGDVYTAVTYIHSQLDNMYFQQLTPIKNGVITINGTTQQIRDLLLAQSSDLEEIADNTENVSNYVDEQREAYENMQNTDGLIDIGNQDQALSIIGALNGVLGNVKIIPAAATCVISGNLGRLDLGDLNLCQGKENFGGIVSFVATTIFLFISFFIVLRIIKKILRIISWARSN